MACAGVTESSVTTSVASRSPSANTLPIYFLFSVAVFITFSVRFSVSDCLSNLVPRHRLPAPLGGFIIFGDVVGEVPVARSIGGVHGVDLPVDEQGLFRLFDPMCYCYYRYF